LLHIRPKQDDWRPPKKGDWRARLRFLDPREIRPNDKGGEPDDEPVPPNEPTPLSGAAATLDDEGDVHLLTFATRSSDHWINSARVVSQ